MSPRPHMSNESGKLESNQFSVLLQLLQFAHMVFWLPASLTGIGSGLGVCVRARVSTSHCIESAQLLLGRTFAECLAVGSCFLRRHVN